MIRGIALLAGLMALAPAAFSREADTDWTQVDQALARKGAVQAGDVHRYGLPRSDLKVTVDGVAIKPALALGSWVAFLPMGADAMLMGDLVLTDTEISPVMKKLLDEGFQITAIHNHLLRSSIAVFYMHIFGRGNPAKLATSLRAALTLSKTPLDSVPASSSDSIDLDSAAIEKVLGAKGKINGGVLQFGFPRAESISESGMTIPPSMGVVTAINFQPNGDGKAAVTGDFVLTATEVHPVMMALRRNGIEVTALHSHMIDETPRLYFMHFWADDDAQKLAKGLRDALQATR